MKKLTLDQTWKLCLSMWRWIAKKMKANKRLDVHDLKEQWLEIHGFKDGSVLCDCFFCEYDRNQGRISKCVTCPGTKVSKINGKLWCQNKNADWRCDFSTFYNKLRSLNRKRLAKRKK